MGALLEESMEIITTMQVISRPYSTEILTCDWCGLPIAHQVVCSPSSLMEAYEVAAYIAMLAPTVPVYLISVPDDEGFTGIVHLIAAGYGVAYPNSFGGLTNKGRLDAMIERHFAYHRKICARRHLHVV